MTAPVESTTCPVRASACRCTLELGHDGPHVCDPALCGGSWTGSWFDFKVVSYPRLTLGEDES